MQTQGRREAPARLAWLFGAVWGRILLSASEHGRVPPAADVRAEVRIVPCTRAAWDAEGIQG